MLPPGIPSEQDAFAKKHGVKLGFMSPFVAACAAALKVRRSRPVPQSSCMAHPSPPVPCAHPMRFPTRDSLQESPAVNAVIDGDDIVYRDYVRCP